MRRSTRQVLLALACLVPSLSLVAAPSAPDLALLPLWRGEVWVVRNLMAGQPEVTDVLYPSTESGHVEGVALSPDGDTAVVLHEARSVIHGGVVTIYSAGLSIFTGLRGPGPYPETILTKDDGIEGPLEVQFLADGSAAVILNVEPVPERHLTLQVLAGLPASPYLAETTPLKDANGDEVALGGVANLASSPDCRHVAVVSRYRTIALVEVQAGDPPALRQEDAADLAGLSSASISFGADSDTILTTTFLDSSPSPIVASRLYAYGGVRNGRFGLDQNVWACLPTGPPARLRGPVGRQGRRDA